MRGFLEHDLWWEFSGSGFMVGFLVRFIVVVLWSFIVCETFKLRSLWSVFWFVLLSPKRIFLWSPFVDLPLILRFHCFDFIGLGFHDFYYEGEIFLLIESAKTYLISSISLGPKGCG